MHMKQPTLWLLLAAVIFGSTTPLMAVEIKSTPHPKLNLREGSS